VDYRAAAKQDFADAAADLGLRISCPVQIFRGEFGKMQTLFDVLATWRSKADDVRGRALPCGHCIPEEAPEALLAELESFLA